MWSHGGASGGGSGERGRLQLKGCVGPSLPRHDFLKLPNGGTLFYLDSHELQLIAFVLYFLWHCRLKEKLGCWRCVVVASSIGVVLQMSWENIGQTPIYGSTEPLTSAHTTSSSTPRFHTG